MNSNNNLSIDLDIDKFKKISKRLQSKIYDKTEYNIKLNIIQESLSESLGFRNLNDLHNKINKKEEKISISTKSNYFSLSDDNKENIKIAKVLLEIFANKRFDTSSSALLLLNIILENPQYFNEQKSLIEHLKSNIFFENVILGSAIKNQSSLKSYKFSIGLYDIYGAMDGDISLPNNNSKSYYDHKQACYELSLAFTFFEKIKDNDIVIYKKNWLKILDLNSKFNYQEPMYNDSIYTSQFYYKSWLHMESYLKLVTNLDYLSHSSSFKISDLLLHTADIISPSLKDSMNLLIFTLLENYNECIEVSEAFKNI